LEAFENGTMATCRPVPFTISNAPSLHASPASTYDALRSSSSAVVDEPYFLGIAVKHVPPGWPPS